MKLGKLMPKTDIEKAEQIVKDLKAAEYKKATKWNKYEDIPYCSKCKGTGAYLKHYGGDGYYYNTISCECRDPDNWVNTKRYKKFLDNADSMTVKDYNTKMAKFKNNIKIVESEYVDCSRSW